MKKPFLLIGILTLILAFYGFQKQKQQIQPERYEAAVRLVLVDVIVTKNGKFVKNLTKDDFELFEDDEKVLINSFELVSFEERKLQIKEETIGKQTAPPLGKKLVVLFDGINSWHRELKAQSERIVKELLSLIRMGNEVMICQLTSRKGIEILQPFTTDEELARRAIARASGTLWRLGSDFSIEPSEPSGPGKVESLRGGRFFAQSAKGAHLLKSLAIFEQTIGGLMGVLNMMMNMSGRKYLLLISGGIPYLAISGNRLANITGPEALGNIKIFDAFKKLRKKGMLYSTDVIEELANFANAQNISIYTLDSDVFIKYIFSGATAVHNPREEIARLKRLERDKINWVKNLRQLSEDTGAVHLRGAKKFTHFRQVMKTDLNYYYQLSFYPRRSKPDDQYHTIKVQVKRPGLDLRHRKGYTDYTKETSEKISLVTSFYNPSLFTDLPFEAEFVPFYSDSGKYEPWMNIALPTKEIFIDRFVEYTQELYHLHIWIKDNMSKEKGYGGKISLPINITQEFMNYIKTVDYLSYHFKGPELDLKQKEYQAVFSLVNSETNEVGAWESVINLPELKNSDSGAFINCVLGNIQTNPKKGPESFTLSKDDGSLEYGNIKFFLNVIHTFKQQGGAHIFMQVYLPKGGKNISPDFKILGKDNEIHVIEKELIANSFTEDSRVLSGLYFLNLSPSSLGENTLYVEILGSEGIIRSRDIKLTVLRGSGEDKIDKPEGPRPISLESVSSVKSKYQTELEEVLRKCSIYCKKLANSVLDFACKERIIEKNWVRSDSPLLLKKEWRKLPHIRELLNIKMRGSRKVGNYYVTEKEWIYDYQLNRNNQKIEEKRILIQEDSLDRKVKDAQLQTNFSHEYMVHGPLSLLGEHWQPYHDYKIVGKAELWGKEAIIIEAVPRPDCILPHALGRIWLNRDDYSILKIEWNQTSAKWKEYVLKNTKMDLITEYNFEKNGIRFPSQHTLEAYDASAKSEKYTWKTEMKVIYEDYNFFTVENEVEVKEPELEDILEKCTTYCKKLADVVLDIVCQEKINETIYSHMLLGTSPKISKYVYDYQLIRKKRRITEQRTLIKENGKGRNEKNATLKTRFKHEYMILGPYGLLSKEKQPYQNYRIVGKKKLWGNEAVIIEAVPRPGVTLDHSWGKVWISKDDYSILKIEWNQSSIKGIESFLENINVYMATEYKFEKNGIRFPSQYILEENYVSARKNVSPRSHKSIVSEIKVTYEDYKFFTVETEVVY